MKKNRMFQYAYDDGVHSEYVDITNIHVVECTERITKNEAHFLWIKYYQDVIEKLKADQRPNMVIWKNCQSDTDYHTIEQEINWQDELEIKNNKIYKIQKTEIEL